MISSVIVEHYKSTTYRTSGVSTLRRVQFRSLAAVLDSISGNDLQIASVSLPFIETLVSIAGIKARGGVARFEARTDLQSNYSALAGFHV